MGRLAGKALQVDVFLGLRVRTGVGLRTSRAPEVVATDW